MSVLNYCNGPFCPYCGCGQAEILQEPSGVRPRAVMRGEDAANAVSGSRWFGGGNRRGDGKANDQAAPWYSGRARCGNCRRTFSFEAFVTQSIPDDGEADVTDDLLDPAPLDRGNSAQPKAPPVPVCPDCGVPMKVSSTRKTVRWHKCPQCGRTKKTPR
jgi:hypothetical protein